MKIITSLFLTILFSCNTCEASISPFIIKSFREIVKLIESDNSRELAKLIDYPLNRENPLPDIKDSADFISHYKILFDNSFKNLLKQYNDSDIFEHDGFYGLMGGNFSGEIWIDENGKICTLNYSSKEEQKSKQILINKIKDEMYPTVNKWNENVLVAQTEKLLIRIDETNKGLRYICWSNSHMIKDKPDIVLYNGNEETAETGGGTWTFKNGDWTYVVDNAEMCENPKDCGLFLELFFKEKLKSKIRLKEIK